jgi:uncharacterized membrane protein
MDSSRLESFSDGVMAVIITIMVFQIEVPKGGSLHDLGPILPRFLIYAVSFVVIGTYWNNHHHLLRAAKNISTAVMWSNLLLLFFLSLIPFFTAWFGNHPATKDPTAAYGAILLACGFAYSILLRSIVASNRNNPKLQEAVGSDIKGVISVGSYVFAVALAFVAPWVSIVIYGLGAFIWFIPERRLEPVHKESPKH